MILLAMHSPDLIDFLCLESLWILLLKSMHCSYWTHIVPTEMNDNSILLYLFRSAASEQIIVLANAPHNHAVTKNSDGDIDYNVHQRHCSESSLKTSEMGLSNIVEHEQYKWRGLEQHKGIWTIQRLWAQWAEVFWAPEGCSNCRNGFDMIQSQPLRSSFKLIISFTFPSLMFQEFGLGTTWQVFRSFSWILVVPF